MVGEIGGNCVAPATHAQNKFLRVRFVFEPAICASKLSLAEPPLCLGQFKKPSFRWALKLAGETGLEPATLGFGDRCSTS
jgi:hypothetical protein